MNELRLLVAAVLLSAGVAAAVAAATVRLADNGGPRLATVRLAEIVAERAGDAARAGLPAAATAAEARIWAAALEDALAHVARRGRVVLLPARAVAAGAPDLTAEVEAALAAVLAHAAAGSALPRGDGR